MKRLVNVESKGMPYLMIWTVYERSRHRVARYIAEQTFVDDTGQTIVGERLLTDTVAELRNELRARKLSCLARDDSDSSRIIEVWL